jgi:hypothetical protein
MKNSLKHTKFIQKFTQNTHPFGKLSEKYVKGDLSFGSHLVVF